MWAIEHRPDCEGRTAENILEILKPAMVKAEGTTEFMPFFLFVPFMQMENYAYQPAYHVLCVANQVSKPSVEGPLSSFYCTCAPASRISSSMSIKILSLFAVMEIQFVFILYSFHVSKLKLPEQLECDSSNYLSEGGQTTDELHIDAHESLACQCTHRPTGCTHPPSSTILAPTKTNTDTLCCLHHVFGQA